MKLRTLTAISAGTALGLAPLTVSQGEESTPVAEPYCAPTVVAHRGGNEAYVENTRNAFNHSYENGVRMVELDVHFTRTDVPVVLHDKTVDRTTTNGSGYVRDMTFTKVRSFRTSDGQQIPSLWEVLKDGKAYGTKYLVELKVNPNSAEWAKFKDRFNSLDLWGNSTVISFDKGTLLEAKSQGFKTGLLDGQSGWVHPDTIKRYATSFYLKRYKYTTDWRVDNWQANGLKVAPWTVNTEYQWQRAVNHPDWGVVTDKPVAYLNWAQGRC